ncbi:MAG: MaoC family dehydratase N-terminal domain-containing protein [Chloroflexi bacterium]|nr:MaoC family dehydratase N-terminal domain-containing protein [Chloroflexota bacterium]
MATTGMAIGHITEEALAELRSRIGVERVPYRYNEEATRDAIRHFCDGIGDDNPLFRDESYARKSRYGCIIAPVMFLNSVTWANGGGMGLPGVHGFNSGANWLAFDTVRVGDYITSRQKLTDVIEKKTSIMGGKAVLQVAQTTYWNHRGIMLATAKGWSMRIERTAAKERGKNAGLGNYRYTPEELRAIEEAYDNEEIRGARVRYWEDVQIGDELHPVVKGPLNRTDLTAFEAGTLGGAALGRGGAHKFLLQYRRRHPAWSRVDPETGTYDIPERVHDDSAFAQEIGVGGAYDYGCQRASWLGNLMTHWIGDDGFLKSIYMEMRGFNVIGDTTWCRGKVTGKRIENGEHLVDCEIRCQNQRGVITSPGRATVVLSNKEVTPGLALG